MTENEYIVIDVEIDSDNGKYKGSEYLYSIYGRVNKKCRWRWLADFAAKEAAEQYKRLLEA